MFPTFCKICLYLDFLIQRITFCLPLAYAFMNSPAPGKANQYVVVVLTVNRQLFIRVQLNISFSKTSTDKYCFLYTDFLDFLKNLDDKPLD